MTPKCTNLASLHDDDARRIAVHEAGHAIAGVRLEKTFDHVEIGDHERGQVVWTHDPFDPEKEDQSPEELRAWQTIYAAGAAAEQAYFGEIRRHAIRCDQICHIRMDKRRKEGVVDLFENALERASNLMNVAELKAVADQLVAVRKIDFDGIAKLIGYIPSWER